MLDWNWYQIVTFAIAVTGAALGFYNTWYARRKDRPRFRVEAHINQVMDEISVTVTITNTGLIDLYIGKIWATRSRLMRWMPTKNFKRVELSFHSGLYNRPAFHDPIKPGNDKTVYLTIPSVDWIVRLRYFTLVAATKTGKKHEFTLSEAANLKVVEIPGSTPSKRIRFGD